jgi:hypothetical protein
MTIAYNFMSLFKQLIIRSEVRHRLKTLRYKILFIPAIIECSGNKTIVKMALHINQRSWIRKLCDKIEQFDSFYSS